LAGTPVTVAFQQDEVFPMKISMKALKGAELAVAAGVAVAVVGVAAANAGTDSTFSTTVTQLTGWASGSLGKLAGVAGIGTALVGLVAKFDWRLIGGALGIGLTAATGPAIVSGLATALF
jgi:conjugal transfer pilus assembly protein TraA